MLIIHSFMKLVLNSQILRVIVFVEYQVPKIVVAVAEYQAIYQNSFYYCYYNIIIIMIIFKHVL